MLVIARKLLLESEVCGALPQPKTGSSDGVVHVFLPVHSGSSYNTSVDMEINFLGLGN